MLRFKFHHVSERGPLFCSHSSYTEDTASVPVNILRPEKMAAILQTTNLDTFIQENAFEIIICEISTILLRPQCVDDKQLPVGNPKRAFNISVLGLHWFNAHI